MPEIAFNYFTSDVSSIQHNAPCIYAFDVQCLDGSHHNSDVNRRNKLPEGQYLPISYLTLVLPPRISLFMNICFPLLRPYLAHMVVKLGSYTHSIMRNLGRASVLKVS